MCLSQFNASTEERRLSYVSIATSELRVKMVLFDLFLYVPVNNFSVMSGMVFLGGTGTKQCLMCLAQGHNTVTPVRPKPSFHRSRAKHSTTESLRSQGEFGTVEHVKASSIFFTDRSKAALFCGSFLLFMFHVCLCYAVLSVPCSLVINYWESAGLLALLCVMVSCVFCHFPKWCLRPGVVFDCIDS